MIEIIVNALSWLSLLMMTQLLWAEETVKEVKNRYLMSVAICLIEALLFFQNLFATEFSWIIAIACPILSVVWFFKAQFYSIK